MVFRKPAFDPVTNTRRLGLAVAWQVRPRLKSCLLQGGLRSVLRRYGSHPSRLAKKTVFSRFPCVMLHGTSS